MITSARTSILILSRRITRNTFSMEREPVFLTWEEIRCKSVQYLLRIKPLEWLFKKAHTRLLIFHLVSCLIPIS